MREKQQTPIITRCINSGCTNKLSGVENANGTPVRPGFFDIVEYAKNGRVFTWEISCPICGCVWWIDAKKDTEDEREKKRVNGEPVVKRYNRDF